MFRFVSDSNQLEFEQTCKMDYKFNLLSRCLMIFILLWCPIVAMSQVNSDDEFEELFSKSYSIRVDQHIEIKNYIEELKEESMLEALTKFDPDYSSVEEYLKSIYPYQKKLEYFLGYPPAKATYAGQVIIEKVGEDKYKDIYRVWVEVVKGVKAYGIYMVPKKLKDTAPLIIAIHGGGGNPEAICGLDTRHPYHSFGYEAVKRGYIIWAPGLTMFSEFSGDSTIIHRSDLDRQLRLMGTSIMGLEIHKIIESTKVLMEKRPEIDVNRVGMTGLSWGAYFTMYTTALAPFIKVAAPSGNFQDTEKELNKIFNNNTVNTVYCFNGFGHFEAVGMICPRPLMIQMGKRDTVFDIKNARREVERATKFYESLGISNRFIFHEHEGGHEYEVETILDFFDENL